MSKYSNLVELKEMFGNRVPNFIEVNKFDEKEFDLKGELFSVRSNCSAEDSSESSFAGQFKSFLNVPKSEIAEKIELVKDSYEELGYSREDTVIIQEMINADYSGVIFTVSPVDPKYLSINIGKGVDSVEQNHSISSYLCEGEKYRKYGQETDKYIDELIEKGKKIEEHFGCGMDVEFCVKEDKIYILQARPITTIEKKAKRVILDNSNIVESYPGVCLPLTESFVKMIYTDIFRSCVKHVLGCELDKDLYDRLGEMVESYQGRMYYRIENWYYLLKHLPYSDRIIPIWQEMLGVKNLEIECDEPKKYNMLKAQWNIMQMLRTCPKKMEELEEFFEREMDGKYEIIYNILKNKITTYQYTCLMDNFHILKNDIMSEWYITLINDLYTFIYTSQVKNREKLGSIKNLESFKVVVEMNELLKSKDEPNISDRVSAYIDKYGDRCLEELKLETKTYRTNPELLYDYIETHEPTELLNMGEECNDRSLKRAKIGIKNREKSRLNRCRLFGFSREVFLVYGEMLKREGRLEDRRDIFYLYLDELEHISIEDYKERVDERKKKYAAYEKLPSHNRVILEDDVVVYCDKDEENEKIVGIGTSKGIAEGEVIIVTEPSTDIDVRGKIVVTETTDPGWVFLLKNCAGVIAKQGSLLSHTSIICREMKKPAVVNVNNFDKLKNGQRVHIDGIKGEIYLLGE